MNYRVAIVEDNKAEAQLMEQYFHRYASGSKDTFQLLHFSDGSDFINNYKPIYDLVMMDVNLPKCNGLDASIALRKIDQSVALIFVTSMVQYAVRGYEVDAMDFLLKPVTYQVFTLKLQRALHRAQQNTSLELLIQLQDSVYRVPVSQIKYIEVRNHSLIYHTTEGNIESRGKLSDLEERLSNIQFIRCNRSYLVNLAFVKSIRGSQLVLDTEELQISRPKKAFVLEALNNYMGGGI